MSVEISKKNPKWVESKANVKIWTKFESYLYAGNGMYITLKFTETNLCSIKMDYFYTVVVLLYFRNLKLNFLL